MTTRAKAKPPKPRRRSSTSSRAAAPPVDPASLAGFRLFANELLRLEDGRPLDLEEFQRTILADYFAGATETLVLLPKKNGKSTLLAALALHHLLVTTDAECVIAAASRDQATILYDQAAGFVRRSEALQELLDVKRGYREIRSRHDAGRIRVLAADVQTADGVIPTLALVDELHRHKSADLYGVFRDGLGPRSGRLITISTAGDDDSSPLGVMRASALALPEVVRSGCHTYARSESGAYVLHEWSLADGDDRSDMAIVKDANPASWQTLEALQRRFESPSMTPWAWARFACGVWLRGQESAIPPEEWDALRGDVETVSAPLIGWDQGWKIDTTALVPLYVEAPDRRVVKGARILTPPGDGSLLDEREVVRALLDLAEPHGHVRVVYDPNAGAQQMVQQLERGDHPEQRGRRVTFEFIEHSQDNAPIALADGRLMEAIRRRVLVHDGDSELRDHVLNAAEKPLGGERFKFDRPRRGARRPIDALRALSMAHSVAVAELEAPPPPSRVPLFS